MTEIAAINQRQAEVQKERNRRSVRVEVVDNGYIITRQSDGSNRIATCREQLLEQFIEMLDDIEGKPPPGLSAITQRTIERFGKVGV